MKPEPSIVGGWDAWEGQESIVAHAEIVAGNGKKYFGPFYDRLQQLHLNAPTWYPNPATTIFRVVTGDELDEARREFINSGLSGHHVHPISDGSPAIPEPEGLTFTGERFQKISQIKDLDLSFYYKNYGNGKVKLNIFQLEPDGLFQFGKNPYHRDASDFWNEFREWQIQQGIR